MERNCRASPSRGVSRGSAPRLPHAGDASADGLSGRLRHVTWRRLGEDLRRPSHGASRSRGSPTCPASAQPKLESPASWTDTPLASRSRLVHALSQSCSSDRGQRVLDALSTQPCVHDARGVSVELVPKLGEHQPGSSGAISTAEAECRRPVQSGVADSMRARVRLPIRLIVGLVSA